MKKKRKTYYCADATTTTITNNKVCWAKVSLWAKISDVNSQQKELKPQKQRSLHVAL